jgi:hypothetical protein
MLLAKVSKFVHASMTSKGTADDADAAAAAPIIANNPALEAKHLQELIEQHIHERSKTLQKELASIEQCLQ